jgi:predicted nuclease of predicted toxin-antitoxin system
MKLLIDMNLSPDWVEALAVHGIDSVHWSGIGSTSAPDRELMAWAKSNGRIVLTHDLDFGAILAATNAEGPSVIQLRIQDLSPGHGRKLVVRVLHDYEDELGQGSLISVDEDRARARILPLR